MNRHDRRARTRGGSIEFFLTGGAIREAAAGLLTLAMKSEKGAWVEGILPTVPPFAFELDFDGAGRILFNPCTLEHQAGRALLAELRRQAPERVVVGTWPLEGEAR